MRSAGQSAWMFASFASFDQRAASARCIAANSAGVFATGSAPSPAILSRTSASANARAISRWSRSTIGCGVPAGATSAIPRRHVESRQTLLGDRRQVRCFADSRPAGNAKCNDGARLHVLQRGRALCEEHLHLAAEHRVHRRRDAVVRDVHDVDARQAFQQLPGKVRPAAVARRRVVERARFRLRERDQLGQRFRAHRRVHDQHVRDRRQHGDRRVILRRIVRKLRVERRRDRQVADRRKRQRVAVRRRLGAQLHADVAAGTGLVLDDEWLVECLREPVAGHSRERVGGTSGRKRHDDPHLMRRVGRLCMRARSRRECCDQNEGADARQPTDD